jgi:hypothetical protein
MYDVMKLREIQEKETDERDAGSREKERKKKDARDTEKC